MTRQPFFNPRDAGTMISTDLADDGYQYMVVVLRDDQLERIREMLREELAPPTGYEAAPADEAAPSPSNESYTELQRDATPHERVVRGLLQVGRSIGLAEAADDPQLTAKTIAEVEAGASNLAALFGDEVAARLMREALGRHLPH